MSNLERVSAEVFIARDPIVTWSVEDLDFIKRAALASPRRRARICAHKTNDDVLHEMLIVLVSGGYIRPHKHPTKSESFHVIEGEINILIFDEDGTPSRVNHLSGSDPRKSFYFRLPPDVYHTVLLLSEIAVVHETTSGPFDPNQTVQAAFAPAEAEGDKARAYMHTIAREAANMS